MSVDLIPAQLAWRCRRGMRELDVLLQRWMETRFAGASARQRALFAALLDLPDPQLAVFLLQGERPAQRELAALIDTVVPPPRAPDASTAADPEPTRGPPGIMSADRPEPSPGVRVE